MTCAPSARSVRCFKNTGKSGRRAHWKNPGPKAEILEAYLNIVTFRGELQGIAAAARGLFAKEPQGLNDFESVILTALVRSPNAGFDAVRARACALARSMSLPGSCTQIDAVARDSLSRPYSVQPAASLAPHVALRLLGNTTGDRENRATERRLHSGRQPAGFHAGHAAPSRTFGPIQKHARRRSPGCGQCIR